MQSRAVTFNSRLAELCASSFWYRLPKRDFTAPAVPAVKKYDTAAAFYGYLWNKGKTPRNKLAVGEYKNLLLKCNEKKDFDYAIKGIKLYQHKGQDFSAEVAAHFIKVALKLEKTKTAAKILADNSIRLGAWAPPKTTLALVQDLVLKNDVETAVKLFKSLTVRGVPQPIDGYKTVLSALQDNGTAENFDIVMESASKAFKEEDYAVLKSSYKRPSAETAGDSEQ